MTNPDILNLN